MFIKVRFPNSIKEYTYEIDGEFEVGVYYLEDKLVALIGKTTQPAFECKKFNGIPVQDELIRRHKEEIRLTVEAEDWKTCSRNSEWLWWLTSGAIIKYISTVPASYILDYVEVLL